MGGEERGVEGVCDQCSCAMKQLALRVCIIGVKVSNALWL